VTSFLPFSFSPADRNFNSVGLTVTENCNWNNICAGVVRGYRIHYVLVNDLGAALEDTKKVLDVVNSSLTEVVVGGLEPDRVYQFEMSAFTRRNEGERTGQKRIQTHAAGLIGVTHKFCLPEIKHKAKRQESRAVAKITARCAQHMGDLKKCRIA